MQNIPRQNRGSHLAIMLPNRGHSNYSKWLHVSRVSAYPLHLHKLLPLLLSILRRKQHGGSNTFHVISERAM